jgi:DNA-binding XRE family transcriptional regulator
MTKIKAKPEVDFFQEQRQKIGDSIRLFREEKDYSQDDLAEIMDVNRSTISKIENGKFAITIDYMVRFGWHLDFDIVLKKNSGKNSETTKKNSNA